MTLQHIRGNFVDIRNRRIYAGQMTIDSGRISTVTPTPDASYDQFILPGFIDAHIHIESSMLAPSEFARMAVIHGTVGTVSDPHEIANVLGMEGIRFMIRNGQQVPFHFYFGASSCVPATTFETSGATITAADIQTLFEQDGLKYLSEMMNFPGVLQHQPDVMAKIAVAKKLGRPIDGHAPGLRGDDALRYASAGITTDHECFSLEEALDKVRIGMKILIREGSAAKNFEALHPLIKSYPRSIMFCSDDKHPHELAESHIDALVKRAIIDKGYDLFDVLQAACLNPIEHYALEVGSLQPGDSADFIVVEDLKDFRIKETYIKGKRVAKDGKSLIPRVAVSTPNHFNSSLKKPSDFVVKCQGEHLRVIVVLEGQIITEEVIAKPTLDNGHVVPDVSKDILKLVVVNRYSNAPLAVAFVKNFGLRSGALASSIAHDSHNIVAVGCSDSDLCEAVNAVIQQGGGIAAVSDGKASTLSLPIAGLMSPDDAWSVADRYSAIDQEAKDLGTSLQAPFMSLSFLALLVIPALKLSDKGLFDANSFKFTNLTF